MPAPLHSFRRQPRSMHAQRGPLSRSSCSLRPPLHDLFLNATCRAEPRTLRIIARSPSWLCRRIGEAMATHIIINDNLCCSCWQSRQVTTGDGANLLIRLDIFAGLVRDGKADAGPNMPPTEHQGSLCTASGCCRSVFGFRTRCCLAELCCTKWGANRRWVSHWRADARKCCPVSNPVFGAPLRLTNSHRVP